MVRKRCHENEVRCRGVAPERYQNYTKDTDEDEQKNVILKFNLCEWDINTFLKCKRKTFHPAFIWRTAWDEMEWYGNGMGRDLTQQPSCQRSKWFARNVIILAVCRGLSLSRPLITVAVDAEPNRIKNVNTPFMCVLYTICVYGLAATFATLNIQHWTVWHRGSGLWLCLRGTTLNTVYGMYIQIGDCDKR